MRGGCAPRPAHPPGSAGRRPVKRLYTVCSSRTPFRHARRTRGHLAVLATPRLCQGCSHPDRHLPAPAALSFTAPLRRGRRRRSPTSIRTTAPHGAPELPVAPSDPNFRSLPQPPPRDAHLHGADESALGAVSGLLPARFPRPLAEPGVRVSTHRALHGHWSSGGVWQGPGCRDLVAAPEVPGDRDLADVEQGDPVRRQG